MLWWPPDCSGRRRPTSSSAPTLLSRPERFAEHVAPVARRAPMPRAANESLPSVLAIRQIPMQQARPEHPQPVVRMSGFPSRLAFTCGRLERNTCAPRPRRSDPASRGRTSPARRKTVRLRRLGRAACVIANSANMSSAHYSASLSITRCSGDRANRTSVCRRSCATLRNASRARLIGLLVQGR